MLNKSERPWVTKMPSNQDKPMKLDPNSFHELPPVDQGLALLALLWMADNNVTLEDVMEDRRDVNS